MVYERVARSGPSRLWFLLGVRYRMAPLNKILFKSFLNHEVNWGFAIDREVLKLSEEGLLQPQSSLNSIYRPFGSRHAGTLPIPL